MHPDYLSGFDRFAFQPLKYDGNGFTKREDGIVSLIQLPQLRDGYHYDPDFVFRNLNLMSEKMIVHSMMIHASYLTVFKGEVIMLPTTTNAQLPKCKDLLLDWLAMGFHSITNALKIFRVSRNAENGNFVAQVYVLGTSSWREIPSVPPCNLSCKAACIIK